MANRMERRDAFENMLKAKSVDLVTDWFRVLGGC